MKEHSYYYQFVDHDTKSIQELLFKVYSKKSFIWKKTNLAISQAEQVDSYVSQFSRYCRWEKMLKNHINALAIRKVLGTGLTTFGNYQIIKEKYFKEMEKVNIDQSDTTSISMKDIKYVEKHSLILSRGAKPEKWIDTFSYQKTHRCYHFSLRNDELDDNIKMDEISNEIVLVEDPELLTIDTTVPKPNTDTLTHLKGGEQSSHNKYTHTKKYSIAKHKIY